MSGSNTSNHVLLRYVADRTPSGGNHSTTPSSSTGSRAPKRVQYHQEIQLLQSQVVLGLVEGSQLWVQKVSDYRDPQSLTDALQRISRRTRVKEPSYSIIGEGLLSEIIVELVPISENQWDDAMSFVITLPERSGFGNRVSPIANATFPLGHNRQNLPRMEYLGDKQNVLYLVRPPQGYLFRLPKNEIPVEERASCRQFARSHQ